MAHIVISCTTGANPAASGDDLVYAGWARCSGMSPSSADIMWTTDAIDPSELALTINEAIRDAAIAAALANDPSYVVGVLDKKTLIGGAIGL